VQRVFYLSGFAKELRLNPQIGNRFQTNHGEIYDEIQKIEKKYAKKLFILNWVRDHLFGEFVMNVLFIAYLIYSAMVLQRISISSVAVLFGSSWSLRHGMRNISTTLTDIADISRYVDRIKIFLDKEPAITSTANLQVDKKLPTEIEFKNVSFRYCEKSPYALKGINLKIRAGKKTAIVGYNGAGKSTLVKLIMRLYDPTEGEVLLNGTNIREYNVEAYREAIGVIFQDFKIFAATVSENVTLDITKTIDEKGIKKSLEKAGFIRRLAKFTLGLNQPLTTEFDELGLDLSGGEAQKVAIARAFFKDAPLIILDEPSSALDPIAEYHLNQTVIDAGVEKTMLFISHRLSTTRVSDEIFLFENGKVAERGTHDDLLAAKGRYYDMWKAQTARYEMLENINKKG